MKKVFLALAAAATIAFSTVAAPTTADARCHGPCAVGLGILGAAAIIGTAAAVANSPAYAYPRDFYPVAGYDRFEYNAAPGYACPDGHGATACAATGSAMWSVTAGRASSARTNRPVHLIRNPGTRASAAGVFLLMARASFQRAFLMCSRTAGPGQQSTGRPLAF